MLKHRILDSVSAISAHDWDRLAQSPPTNPFVRHAFLATLEETGCVGGDTGWSPKVLTLWDANQLVGAMPLYMKTHSYGEYVFDWAWARAYQEHGLRYYPKLLCAIPFTPVRGPRLLAASRDIRQQLLKAAVEFTQESGASSLHILFPPDECVSEFEEAGLMLRSTVQFHWRNHGYADFDAFLASMNHDKRKKIKQERRRLHEAGVSFHWRGGHEATEEEWEFFCRCYFNTYRQHASSPYLNRRFFRRLALCMPENVNLVFASCDGVKVASALNIHDDITLYGRYWGSTVYIPGLHFETCYHQAIDFCIQRGLQVFEGGAQGEHKLARGLLPVRTQSAHWVAHPGFAQAIDRYLAQEGDGIGHYVSELNEHSPFKATSAQP